MSTYEITYLILVGIQTGFLIWYAYETMLLRKAAAAQTKTVADQATATIQALRLQERQFLMSLEPVFDFHFALTQMQQPCVSFENMKDNVSYAEFRCNVQYSIAPPNIGTNATRTSKRFIGITGPQPTVFYFGIKYRDMLGELKTKVYEVTTVTGAGVLQPNYDYNALLYPMFS